MLMLMYLSLVEPVEIVIPILAVMPLLAVAVYVPVAGDERKKGFFAAEFTPEHEKVPPPPDVQRFAGA
jgi:hypothetical protein